MGVLPVLKVMFNKAYAAWLLTVGMMALLGYARPAGAELTQHQREVAERIAHVLGYVHKDYGPSVSDGAVVNAFEYEEQLGLLAEAAASAGKLEQGSAAVADELAKVRRSVENKRPAVEVQGDIDRGLAVLVKETGVEPLPSSRPSFERGRTIYQAQCAACHGVEGRPTAAGKALEPPAADFGSPDISLPLSPARAAMAMRFGVAGTAMASFPLSDAERWDVAFYVCTLAHAAVTPVPPTRGLSLHELARSSDDRLLKQLTAPGAPNATSTENAAGHLAYLRARAPYEASDARALWEIAEAIEPMGGMLQAGEHSRVSEALVDLYLERFEPLEGTLGARLPERAASLELSFQRARGYLTQRDSKAADALGDLVAELEAAAHEMEAQPSGPNGSRAFFSSLAIFLREGVEAALLVGILIGLARKSDRSDLLRWIHGGWVAALIAGLLTWVVSVALIDVSGLAREMIEGGTALIAAGLLYYVSSSVLGKVELVRWLAFLREGAENAKGRAQGARMMFAMSFVATYREAFETVLFYQALFSSETRTDAVVGGIGVAAVGLIVFVLVFSRAGKFAPPRVFFQISGGLLSVLAIAFAGQGIAALQLGGVLPAHMVGSFSLPLLGIYPTVESLGVQLALLALIVRARWRRPSEAVAKPALPTGEAG